MKLLFSLLVFGLFSCSSNANVSINEPQASTKFVKKTKDELSKYDKAYFASGCFWCVEAIYEGVEGVVESISGYNGGHTQNPTYELSNTGNTGHAEAVEIYYDANVVSFEDLVDVYFGSHNITQINGQGPDHGSQYRSIIFYQNEEEKQFINDKIETLNGSLKNEKVASEVMQFEMFWMGEDYHQDFERLHPNHPYIQSVSIPRLRKFQAKYPELLKKHH